jgi:hypothetical protein
MVRRPFFGLIFLGLMVMAFFYLTNSAYRQGWSQGYVTGRLADGDEAVEPSAAYGYRGPVAPGMGYAPYFGLGRLMACLLPLLFVGIFLKVLCSVAGRHHGGRWRHGHHGKWRPAWGGDDAPATEKVMKA